MWSALFVIDPLVFVYFLFQQMKSKINTDFTPRDTKRHQIEKDTCKYLKESGNKLNIFKKWTLNKNNSTIRLYKSWKTVSKIDK